MPTPTALPSAFVAGDILTAANMNLIRGGFRVLQVVTGTTATEVISSSTTYADTGLTATITPSALTNKILIFVAQQGAAKSAGNASNAINIKLLRGASEIQRICNSVGYTNTALALYTSTISTMFLDSPATIAATTYKTTFANDIAAANVRLQDANISTSTIILMEISA